MKKPKLEGPWLLSIDSSTGTLAVGLSSGPKTVAQVTVDHGRTHATVIMDAIGMVLELGRIEPAVLDGLVAGRGPGSFTGLRIGLATVKAMALALSRPVVAVSSLAGLAWPAAVEGLEVWAVIDAGRQQVYCCRYRPAGDGIEPLCPEQVLYPRQLVARTSNKSLLVGSGAVKYRDYFRKELGDRAVFASGPLNSIQPVALACLGWRKWSRQGPVEGDEIAPVYLRRPDAELPREAMTPAAGG